MSLLPYLLNESALMPRKQWISLFCPEEALRPLDSALNQLADLDKDVSISLDKDKFQANIDVQQFKPEELTVKLNDDNTVTVEGKHEEQQDEHGYISRHFVRRYVLPEDCDIKGLQSKLSSDGVLSITAPKKPEHKQVEYKQIPIVKTGPIKRIQDKSEQVSKKKAS
ncbi:alpha-crystallin A chain-like isoform X1 [Anthonomus grandis grandis]|uniref:alpha-crystallin A chain-like isoform X1 n=1 Tax=Anthonomus grandis grandis TaxID=2921223 RepID=UPI0021662566|nr:alpha-crystallin A chain-like isoform X1 [Anthonomus grandis grandis]